MKKVLWIYCALATPSLLYENHKKLSLYEKFLWNSVIFGVLILKKFMLNQNSSNNTKATELHHVTTFQKTDKMANLLILHELEWDTFFDHI